MPTLKRRVAYPCRAVCWALPHKHAWALVGKFIPPKKVVPVSIAGSDGIAKDLAWLGDGKIECWVREYCYERVM